MNFEDLLQTKIFTPALREDYVSRSRLTRRLDEVGEHQDILVTAPAGYGKTLLIVEWLQSLRVNHAWFSLDPRDNDLGRFLTYVVYALHQTEPSVCSRVLELVQSPEPPPAARLIDHLINDLACLQNRVILALDDYQVIDNQEVHEAVSYLLHHRPSQLQIVLLSREEMPFPVSDLRAKNRLAELGLFDLRFTIKEAHQFLKAAFDLDLPFEQVVQLDNQVEGWVTGLQLAALSLRDAEDRSEFIERFSGEDQFIQSYLFEEVISNQPERIQDFLIHTAGLDWLSAPLCNWLLDRENSQDLLEHLVSENLFLIPLDNRGRRFRYHQLFREALEKRLWEREPDQAARLLSRASHWFENRGDLDTAVDYAVRGEDFSRAGDLIAGIANRKIREGGRRRLRDWLSAFPLEVLRRRRLLWTHLITTQLGLGMFDRAARSLDQLWGDPEILADFSDYDQKIITGLSAGFRSSIEIHTTLDGQAARDHAQAAMDTFPEDVDFGRSIGPGYFAVACFHLGEVTRAREHITRALQLSERHEYSRLNFLWSCYQAMIEIQGGNLAEAERLIQQVMSRAERLGIQESNLVSSVIIARGLLAYERNQLQAARGDFQRGVAVAEAATFLDYLIWGYKHYLRYLAAEGRFQEAHQTLETARAIARKYHRPVRVRAYLEAFEAYLNLSEGNLDRAQHWARTRGHVSREDPTSLEILHGQIQAQIWLAGGQPARTLALLTPLVDQVKRLDCGKALIEIRVLLARAHAAALDHEQALEELSLALEQAYPERYIRTFLEGGSEIKQLLQRRILADDPTSRPAAVGFNRYLEELLQAFEAEEERLRNMGVEAPAPAEDGLLTPRETEILKLLAEGLSYAELAGELSITENTVKTHIKNIYRKLDVGNRTEAVNQGRKLQVI
jgi:LuxR family maltose regulon positive regulatory protein